MSTATDLQAPYVTAYTQEIVDLSLAISACEGAMDGRHLAYEEPRRDDWLLDVLWARQEDHRRGDPLFRELHILRQRECMLDRLCQVCRGSPVDSAGRIWWVFNQQAPGVSARTGKPPTCRPCIRDAIRSCGYLRRGAYVYTSGEYTPYGVIGDVFSVTPGGVSVRRGQEIALTEFYRLEYTLARGLIVQVSDFRPEQLP